MSARGTRTRAHPVIAIDGPAGSGKSTVSRALSERLGMDRLDTGAMYRAVAWAALERGIEPTDRPSVAGLARALTIRIGERVEADGTDITEAIRGPRVSRAVSAVAANPEVRTVLVQRQRQWVAERGGGIVEGRDIGSVVFPHADVKIYLTAAADERARRRPEEGADAVARRDRLDSTRTASPLGVADGARVIDTTDRPVEDIVEEVVAWL
jgi:cytidylate kinase